MPNIPCHIPICNDSHVCEYRFNFQPCFPNIEECKPDLIDNEYGTQFWTCDNNREECILHIKWKKDDHCEDKLCHTKSYKNNECVYDKITPCCTDNDQCEIDEYCDYSERQNADEGTCKKRINIINSIMNNIQSIYNNRHYYNDAIRYYTIDNIKYYVIDNNLKSNMINAGVLIFAVSSTYAYYILITRDEGNN